MIFVFEKFLKERDNVVCVDANFNAKLQISHWPGNNTPSELKADTSTEMAFKLIESDLRDEYLNGISVVSNNHFDSDGVLAAYVLLNPDDAGRNKQALINIARTGDFREFTTEDALKADRIIELVNDPEKGPYSALFENHNFPELIQILYEKAFDLIPDLTNSVEPFQKYWEEDFNHFLRSEESFKTQQSVFSNYGDIRLSVLESDFKIHPVSKNSQAEYEIMLSSVRKQDGRLFELEYKPVTWFDTTQGKRIERKNLESLAGKLNQIEQNENGLWKVLGNDPVTEWDYRMQFSDEKFNLVNSKIEVYELENILFDYFFD